MAWTSDRVETLTGLWREGFSARQIAERLGGVSRNAVIAKLHRLGLTRGRKPSLAKPALQASLPAEPNLPGPARSAASDEVRKATMLPALVRSGPIEIAFVQDGCQWPIDDAETSLGHRSCGAPLAKGSYCAAHAARATESQASEKARKQQEANWADPAIRARRERSLKATRERRVG